MSQDTQFLRARFLIPNSEPLEVHFNPATLQYTLTNTMQQRGGGNKQFVTGSTGKLTMDLVFDTTHDGADVRITTEKLLVLMKPKEKLVPTVTFEWGLYKFEGTMETYKETLDFFSPNGVPLRASLSLGLAATKEQVFARGTGKKVEFKTEGSFTLDAVVLPPEDSPAGRGQGAGGAGPGIGAGGPTAGGVGGSPQDVATRGGNPGGARALAAANGAESLRAPAAGGLAVSASISLSPPVAFASAGGGAGAGFGIGGGAGLGIGGGAAAGFGMAGGAGAGFGMAGGAAAGFGMSGGAAAGFGMSSGAAAEFGMSGGAAAGFGLSGGAAAGIGMTGGVAAGIGITGGASAGFASAGAGAGIGFSAGAGAGFGAAGGGFAFAGASASASGFRVGSASAGVTATQGAFAGLRATSRVEKTATFRVERLLPDAHAAHLATGQGARFAVGGRALVEGGGSLRADVGATATLRGRVSFDGEG